MGPNRVRPSLISGTKGLCSPLPPGASQRPPTYTWHVNQDSQTRAASAGKQPGWLGFILPPILLGSVVLTASFLLASPPLMFGALTGAILLGGLLWILASSLWASKADRDCPECGRQKLVRLDPATTMGLSCSACGWKDESASSWYLAEEEGPLEQTVMKSRGRGPLVIRPWAGDDRSQRPKIKPKL